MTGIQQALPTRELTDLAIHRGLNALAPEPWMFGVILCVFRVLTRCRISTKESSESAEICETTIGAPLSFILVLMLTCAFCPATFAQRYQSFSGSGPGVVTGSANASIGGPDCNTAAQSQYSSTTVNVMPYLSYGTPTSLGGSIGTLKQPPLGSTFPGKLPLVRSGAKWKPFNVISYAYVFAPCALQDGGDATLTTTLSGAGILRTAITSFSTSAATSSVETLDLNSGLYSYHFRYAYGCCGGEHASIQFDAEGTLSLTFVPASNDLTIRAVNPYACDITFLSPCYDSTLTIDPDLVPGATSAGMLSADGVSAVVLVITAPSTDPVTLSLSNATGNVGYPGSLSAFDPAYLMSSNPNTDLTSLQVTPACDSSGSCTALALLWSPQTVPVTTSSSAFTAATVNITVTQGTTSTAQTSIDLEPPPLLLVHGVWSSASEAWTPFTTWLTSGHYPHNIIGAVDYQPWNFKAFDDTDIQNQMSSSVSSLLQLAAAQGMAARTVDVVGHSMGGLVTRYFGGNLPPKLKPILPPNPIHKFITIGTPHQGSPLAALLDKYQTNTTTNTVVKLLCNNPFNPISPCQLGNVLAAQGNIVGAATISLEPTSGELKNLASPPYSAIVGEEPTSSAIPLPFGANSGTEVKLSLLTTAFLPESPTDYSILNALNDTIVPNASQSAGATDAASITGVVHTALVSADTGETASPDIWNQTLFWLMGGTGPATSTSSSAVAKIRALDISSSASPLTLDLTGYTQIDASNVTFTPAPASSLTVNSPINIAATSSKSITEVVLFQSVADLSDIPLFYSTQSPFSIPFTPTRMGTTNFTAVAVFSDNTYAVAYLNYTLQPSGTPSSLSLVNLPQGSMAVGSQLVTHAQANFSSGLTDVTQSAVYTTGSGTTNVFSVAGGLITANGPGVDTLNVSYGGVTASAQILVGSCSYSLSSSNPLVGYAGGSASVAVASGAGCGWTATSDSAWLAPSNAAGSGNGTVTLTASANATGSTRVAVVSVGGQTLLISQAAGSALTAQTITFPAIPTQTVATPLALTATATSSLTVSYSASPASVCAVSGSSATFTASGTCTITASQAGNSSYSPAAPISQSFSVIVVLQTQTITFGAIPAEPVGASLTLSATASSGLPVSYSSYTPSVCTVSGSTPNLLSPGTCTITASQAGSSIYAAATPVTQSFTVLRYTPQSITFAAITNQTAGTPLTLSATASSGLPVTFSASTTSVCTVSGKSVTFLNAGSCTMTALQAGNGTYSAATPVTQSFTVYASPSPQIITFGAIATQTAGTPLTLSATVNSPLAVAYSSSTPSVCTISGGVVTFLAAGTCTITASQAGDSGYPAATPVTQSFTVQLPNTLVNALQKVLPSDLVAPDTFGFSVALSGDGSTALVGAVGNNSYRGTAYVFIRTSGIWSVQQELTASDGVSDDDFGFSVALSNDGNTALVGAFGKNSLQGSAYVFTRQGATWSQQQELSASNGVSSSPSTGTGGYFAVSLALSSDGNTALIGASLENGGTGAAYVFARSGTSWSQQQELTATGAALFDDFGVSVALSSDGNTALIGADAVNDFTGVNTGTGAAYQFTRSSGIWSQKSKLTSPDATSGAGFGAAVGLSGDGNTALVGAQINTQTPIAGAAYVFTQAGGSWSEQQKLTASDAAAADFFGGFLALSSSGNSVIISAFGKNSFAGAAYLFTQTQGSWSEQREMTASDAAGNDRFALSLALSNDGTTALVGAPLKNSSQGAAYFFGLTPASSTVQVTVGTNPAGLAFSVDGTQYTSAQAFTWNVGDNHTLATTSPQTGAGGANYAFSQWNGGITTLSETVVAPSSSTGYTANFTVAIAQTITFAPVKDQVVGTPLTLTASATSNLAVTYTSSASSVCTVAGAIATFLTPGTCTITAAQAGNSIYGAAASVTHSFSVVATQTITFANPGTQTTGTPLTLAAAASSGLPVSYTSSTPFVCTISGSTTTLLEAGTCTITAAQAGSALFAPALSVAQTFKVVLEPQTITFGAIAAQTYGSTFALGARASSGLPITYTLVQNGACSISGNVLTFLNTPSCSVVAAQPGNNVYAAATPVEQTITVNPAGQTITFNSIASQTVFTKLTIGATASSGLPVGFTLVPNGNCSLSGNVVTFVNVGNCGVVATQAGDSNYTAAAAVGQIIVVTPASQTIGFGALANKIQGTSLTLSAAASSGLAVSFASLTPLVCTVAGTTVSTPNPGTCTIQASQPGGGNYAAATAVTQSFTVAPAFTVTVSPQGQAVLPGLLALVNVQIQSASGGYSGFVTLSCSGGPAGSSCLGAPLPVPMFNGSGSGVVSILVPLRTPSGKYTETLTLTSGSLTDTGTVSFSVR